MKIFQLIQQKQHRGAETFACQLSKHLIRKGCQVLIISIFEGTSNLNFEGEITCLKASRKARFTDIKAWKKLAELIKIEQPDIIQANAGDTLKYAVLSKLVYRWKVPIVSRNASEVGRYLKSSVHKKLNSFFYRQVAAVYSVSEASQKDLLAHFPFLKNRTQVLPIGIEESNDIKLLDFSDAQASHIVHIGGFSFEKNHEGLIQIFERVKQKASSVKLHLVGDGPLRSKIEKIVQQKKLQQDVHFHGFVNNPLDYIKTADVLVLPSIIEGLPGVILDALYCETPVVAYNVGGVSEVVNEETGWLIDKNEKEKFATAVLSIIKNTDQAEQRSLRAKKMINENFKNKNIALKFMNAYKDLKNKPQF